MKTINIEKLKELNEEFEALTQKLLNSEKCDIEIFKDVAIMNQKYEDLYVKNKYNKIF